MNQKVYFCGEERKFQRCANKTLKDYQKSIEDIQEKLTPLAEATRDYQFKLTELEDEIKSIDKHIELLEKLDDANDDEIRECISLTKDKIKLQKEIHTLRKANDDVELEASVEEEPALEEIVEGDSGQSHVLKDDSVTSVLVGASKPQQILDNIKAIENTSFTEEELKEIDRNSCL